MFDLDDGMITPMDVREQSMDMMLESLSLDIVQGNIEGQIDGSLSPNRDFLSIVISKYNTIKNNTVSEDDMRLLQGELIDFSNNLIDRIKDHYNLFINLADDDSMECLELLSVLYTFFVTNHEFYARTFLLEYIRINKVNIIDTMGIGGKSTDVTTQAFKKKNLNRNDVAILANINPVIDFVSDEAGVTPDEFLSYVNDGDYYINEMIGYIQGCVIGGDFVETYLDEVVDDRCSNSALRIRNDIRTMLCNGN